MTLIGTSKATLSDTQDSNTGNLVSLNGSSGQGRISVKGNTSGLKVYADARRIRLLAPDSTIATVSTTSSTWSSWSPLFILEAANRGHYVRVRGDARAATGEGEFQCYQ